MLLFFNKQNPGVVKLPKREDLRRTPFEVVLQCNADCVLFDRTLDDRMHCTLLRATRLLDDAGRVWLSLLV